MGKRKTVWKEARTRKKDTQTSPEQRHKGWEERKQPSLEKSVKEAVDSG